MRAPGEAQLTGRRPEHADRPSVRWNMREYSAEDEDNIIRQCLNGNAEKFSVLVERYRSLAFNVAFRMLGDQDAANDMAQDSFIAAYKGLRDFHHGSRFSTWLYRIVMNKCRDYLRAGKDTVSVDEIAELRSDPKRTPEEKASGREAQGIVQEALNALPPDYREVIVLKHIEELDYQEISVILGVGITALKVRAHRAREMLRDVLEKTGMNHG
jgi:RNA polymerase sigma-70 factor (ECF subfamily)